ncbi:TPA: hypothetical protein JD349_27430 [Serratia marcescens]|nr:hypothetical protein [Serratia marcescens]HAU5758729.1 hypothetical protein [Serratia marcescens]
MPGLSAITPLYQRIIDWRLLTAALRPCAPFEAPIVITLYFGPLPGATLSGVILIAPMIFPADAGV